MRSFIKRIIPNEYGFYGYIANPDGTYDYYFDARDFSSFDPTRDYEGIEVEFEPDTNVHEGKEKLRARRVREFGQPFTSQDNQHNDYPGHALFNWAYIRLWPTTDKKERTRSGILLT